MIWYDMIWYDMIWYDMIWYDMIWYDKIYVIWYDMIWYDNILVELRPQSYRSGITNRDSVVKSFGFAGNEGQTAKDKRPETLRCILNNYMINIMACARYGVFMAVRFYFIVFRVVMTCKLLRKYQIFRDKCCFHL